ILFSEHADAHRVNQRVAGVTRREVHLAAQRRDPDAVAVVADAVHHTAEQIAIAGLVERSESQAVEERHGPGAHREDVAQDAPGTRRRALVRLDRRGVVVRLDLEGDSPAVGESEHARVLARSLNHLGSRGWEGLQDRPGVLVRAVLAPQGGEDAQLGERGCSAEQRFDARVLFGREVVFLDQLWRDGGIPWERDHFRVTPLTTARYTRARTFGCGDLSRASASPASNQIP